MKVDILEWPDDKDWAACRWLAISTTKKNYDISKLYDAKPTDDWKYKILRARHSPIRRLTYLIHITDIPYYLSTHFARHKIGWEPFVTTQRNDRQTAFDREKIGQGNPTDMTIFCNAESIQTVMQKRLCGQADAKAREIARAIRDAVLEKTPQFRDLLAPPCVLFGRCMEMRPCGRAGGGEQR